MEGEVKICPQLTCFSCRSGPCIPSECLLELRIGQSNIRGKGCLGGKDL